MSRFFTAHMQYVQHMQTHTGNYLGRAMGNGTLLAPSWTLPAIGKAVAETAYQADAPRPSAKLADLLTGYGRLSVSDKNEQREAYLALLTENEAAIRVAVDRVVAQGQPPDGILEEITAAEKDIFDIPNANRNRGTRIERSELREQTDRALEKYLTTSQGWVSNAFMRKLADLAYHYVSQGRAEFPHISMKNYAPGEMSEWGILFSVIGHPRFIGDPRIVPVMEKLWELTHNQPWESGMYFNFQSYKPSPYEIKAGYELNPGFGIDHVATFGMLIATQAFWFFPSPSHVINSFFDNIARVLERLTDQDPAQVFPVRFSLLERNVTAAEESHAPNYYFANTFTSPRDQEALRAYIETKPGTAIERVGRKILDREI